MDKLKTTDLGGFPFVLDDIRQFLGRLTSPANHGIYQAFNNILGGFGTDFIVQGCVVSGSTGAFSITEGWILLGGELIKVDAQGPFDEAVDSKFVKDTTFDPRGNKDFLNGSTADTYEKNRAVIQGTTGNLAFNGQALGLWGEDDFDASDYTATTGSWILLDAFTEVRTMLFGKMMTISLNIASTISGGPTDQIKLKVPRGATVSKVMTNSGIVFFSGLSVVAIFQTVPGDNTIRIQPIDGTDFPNGNLNISAQITIEVD